MFAILYDLKHLKKYKDQKSMIYFPNVYQHFYFMDKFAFVHVTCTDKEKVLKNVSQ